jgi:hypothetical protein
VRLAYFSYLIMIVICCFVRPASAAAKDNQGKENLASSDRVESSEPSRVRALWAGLQLGEQIQTSTNNRDLNMNPNYGLALGYETVRPSGIWGLSFDLVDQRDSSGSGNVSITRERWTAGLALQFAPNFTVLEKWRIYALAGVAFFQDHVQTSLASPTNPQSSTDYGTWEPIARAGFGVWYTKFAPLRLGSELRILYSAQLNPQITEELLVRVVYAW